MNFTDMSDRDYEKLTQNIHRAIMHSEGVNSIVIEHNKKILGRSGQYHQIDVYWTYKIAGVKHQTAIECRFYRNSISVGKIRDFLGVLTDIGNIQGVMITTSGYQSGAKKLADHYGIRLAIIRDVDDVDLRGLISTVIINMIAVKRTVINWNLTLSLDWLAANSVRPEDVRECRGMSNEVGLFDAEGTLKKSFFEIENSLPLVSGDGIEMQTGIIHTFVVDVAERFFKHDKFGLIPVHSFNVDYRIDHLEHVIRVGDPCPTNVVYENFDESGARMHIHADGEAVVIKGIISSTQEREDR